MGPQHPERDRLRRGRRVEQEHPGHVQVDRVHLQVQEGGVRRPSRSTFLPRAHRPGAAAVPPARSHRQDRSGPITTRGRGRPLPSAAPCATAASPGSTSTPPCSPTSPPGSTWPATPCGLAAGDLRRSARARGRRRAQPALRDGWLHRRRRPHPGGGRTAHAGPRRHGDRVVTPRASAPGNSVTNQTSLRRIVARPHRAGANATEAPPQSQPASRAGWDSSLGALLAPLRRSSPAHLLGAGHRHRTGVERSGSSTYVAVHVTAATWPSAPKRSPTRSPCRRRALSIEQITELVGLGWQPPTGRRATRGLGEHGSCNFFRGRTAGAHADIAALATTTLERIFGAASRRSSITPPGTPTATPSTSTRLGIEVHGCDDAPAPMSRSTSPPESPEELYDAPATIGAHRRGRRAPATRDGDVPSGGSTAVYACALHGAGDPLLRPVLRGTLAPSPCAAGGRQRDQPELPDDHSAIWGRPAGAHRRRPSVVPTSSVSHNAAGAP